jgi:serine/threonine protein kinase
MESRRKNGRSGPPQQRVAVFCTHCKQGYRVASRLLGRRMICRHCRSEFRAVELDSAQIQRLRNGEAPSDSPDSAAGRPGSSGSLPTAGRHTVAIDTSWAGRHLGRYKVLSILGQGGMGVVWRGHDDRLRRDVAIKLLNRDGPRHGGSIGGISIDLFMQEARAVAKLQHPAVVGIYEVVEDQGQIFLALELMDGGTLKEQIDREGPMLPRELFSHLVGPTRALALAHERGIIHRDIKPGNLMFDEHGHLKLMDFGLADVNYEVTSQRMKGKAVGSLGWIAPETARGKGTTGSSDIYGFGLVMMFALTGKPWIHAKSRSELIALHQNPPELDLSGIDGLTPRAEAMIRRCLAEDPSQRFASANELADALEVCGEEDPGEKRRWRMSHASVAVAAAITGGVFVGAGVLYYFLNLSEREDQLRRPVADFSMSIEELAADDALAPQRVEAPTAPPDVAPLSMNDPSGDSTLSATADGRESPASDPSSIDEAKLPWPRVPDLVDADSLRFIGSESGRVFHIPSTECGRSIFASNLVNFATKKEAEASGRHMCRRCSEWLSEHGEHVAEAPGNAP